MNVYEKLQQARKMLLDKKIKKTGENKFSNYTYFELGDFMPQVISIFAELKLFSFVNFPDKENATLTIINTEKTDETIVYNTSVGEVSLKGAHGIQNLGAVQTYLRRYLYINALEISENDNLDNGNLPPEEDVSKLKIDKHKVTAIKSMIEKTETDLDMFCTYYDITSIEEMTNEQWVTGMKALEKKEHQKKETKPKQETGF